MSDYKTYSTVKEKLKTATKERQTKTAVCSSCKTLNSFCTVFKTTDETLYVCDSCLWIMEITDKIIGLWYQ